MSSTARFYILILLSFAILAIDILYSAYWSSEHRVEEAPVRRKGFAGEITDSHRTQTQPIRRNMHIHSIPMCKSHHLP
jgi:hypothetical protein